MYNAAIVLAFLTSAGHGRRVQSSQPPQQLQRSLAAEMQRTPVDTSKAFGMLLLAANSEAGFACVSPLARPTASLPCRKSNVHILMADAVTEAEAKVAVSGLPAGADWVQIAKYPVATAVQFSLIATFFKALDVVGMPALLVPPLFGFLSLRSRIFSMLPANRPPRGGFNVDGKRVPTPPETKRPWWTPPGIAFPFIWLTITALRAASSFFVFKAVGDTLFSPPLLLLALHLSVGDTWNCVTNVEQRKGVSALGVLAVWTSVMYAVKAYYNAAPIAGYLLAPSACWLSIASVLTWTIWKMNPPLQPLLPQKGDGQACDVVMPLIFRPKACWKVITTPPTGPPQKKEDAM